MNDDGWVQMHRRQRVECLHFQEEEEEEEGAPLPGAWIFGLPYLRRVNYHCISVISAM